MSNITIELGAHQASEGRLGSTVLCYPVANKPTSLPLASPHHGGMASPKHSGDLTKALTSVWLCQIWWIFVSHNALKRMEHIRLWIGARWIRRSVCEDEDGDLQIVYHL